MKMRCVLSVTAASALFILFSTAGSSGQEIRQLMDAATADLVIPYAYMSQDAYNSSAESKNNTARNVIPGGWTRIADGWEDVFTKGGLSDQINGAKAVGFDAAIYQKIDQENKRHIAIVFPGSDTLSDWVYTDREAACLGIKGSCRPPPQYVYAGKLADAVQKVYSDAVSFSAAGHSKGAGQAIYAGQQPGKINTIIAINPATPGFLSSVTRAGVREINVVVPHNLTDATNSVWGMGHPPGDTYVVNSKPSNIFSKEVPLNRFDPVVLHSIDGVIGGLCDVSPASCSPRQATTYGQQTKTDWTTISPQPKIPGAPAVPRQFAPGGISLSVCPERY